MKRIVLNKSSVYILFLFFLPFTKALTLDIGFPLKISEVILGILIFVYCIKIHQRDKFNNTSLISIVLVTFLFWTTASFLINSLWKYDYGLKDVPFRMNAFVDSLWRLIYVYLSVIVFFISKKHLKYNKILKFWVTGAIVAGIYSWYLFIFSGLNMPYIKLFGMDDNPQSLFGFIRCGTFSEGNFFGLYLLLSIVISFHIKRYRAAFFLILTTITTFSTVTIVSLSVFLLFVFRKTLLNKKSFTYAAISFPVIIIASLFFIKTPFFENQIYNKLAQPSYELSSSNVSKVDRVLTARIAFKQGLNNPFFGVGPYNYGLHYDEYNDFETYIKNNNSWSKSFFKRVNRRAIPNNVYLEVWAEYGIIGFFLFTSFLILLLIKTYKSNNQIMIGGTIALLISFNAFPSFIMLFIWAFLAIPTELSNNQKEE